MCAYCGTRSDDEAVFCENCRTRQVLQIGDIKFTREGIVVGRGRQAVTSVPRSAVSSMEIESGASDGDFVNTILGTVLIATTGLRIIASNILYGLLFILLGGLAVYSVARRRTVVRIWSRGTMKGDDDDDHEVEAGGAYDRIMRTKSGGD